MNRKQLISALASRTGGTKADAERQVSALLDIISDTLQEGGKVSLSGFGTFEVRKRAERNGRNPKTGETLRIGATRAPAFRAGSPLKAALNKSR